MCARGWTEEQDKFLKEVYENTDYTVAEICTAIGKGETTIRTRAKLFGLKRRYTPFEKEGMKLCPKCGEHLPLEMFPKNNTKRKGVASYCKSCEKISKIQNAEKAKENEKLKNREKNSEKKCTRCGEIKPISEFYKTGGMCKICRNERNKEIDFEKLKKRGYIK